MLYQTQVFSPKDRKLILFAPLFRGIDKSISEAYFLNIRNSKSEALLNSVIEKRYIMKKLFFVFFFYLIIFPICANAEIQDVFNFSGHDWSGWEKSRKHNFISGFILGSGCVAHNNLLSLEEKYDSDQAWAVYMEYIVPDKKKPKNSFSRNDVMLILNLMIYLQNNSVNKYLIIEITNNQLVDGLDLFFSDFKNKQIKLRDAIYVVKKQIKGASPDEIEAILQYLRSDKDSKKLWYTAKDGKKKLASFP